MVSCCVIYLTPSLFFVVVLFNTAPQIALILSFAFACYYCPNHNPVSALICPLWVTAIPCHVHLALPHYLHFPPNSIFKLLFLCATRFDFSSNFDQGFTPSPSEKRLCVGIAAFHGYSFSCTLNWDWLRAKRLELTIKQDWDTEMQWSGQGQNIKSLCPPFNWLWKTRLTP